MNENSIQIYATKVIIESEHQSNNVWLEGVDYYSILAELPTDDVINYVIANYHSDYMTAIEEANEE